MSKVGKSMEKYFPTIMECFNKNNRDIPSSVLKKIEYPVNYGWGEWESRLGKDVILICVRGPRACRDESYDYEISVSSKKYGLRYDGHYSKSGKALWDEDLIVTPTGFHTSRGPVYNYFDIIPIKTLSNKRVRLLYNRFFRKIRSRYCEDALKDNEEYWELSEKLFPGKH